jgi:predicted enzyme related to lactoylglutathione lyase
MAHPVAHFQMITTDPVAAQSFYSQLFGWTVDAPDAMGFRPLSTGSPEGIHGGLWPAPPGVTGFVQLFVATDDVASSVAEATRLGAKVLVQPTALPEGGEVAVLHDPQGIPFGLWRKA